MKTLLRFAAILEAVTGLALITGTALVTRLLLGESAAGVAAALGRLAGFALLALGVACWPIANSENGFASAFRAMLTYNLLVTLFILFLGIGSEFVGPLLWPAMALHTLVTSLLVSAWYKDRSFSRT